MDGDKISIHNSKKELAVTPELIDSLGADAMSFSIPGAGTLPYREFVSGGEDEGEYSLFIFFHGVGSVGDDDFLQMRIPGPPMINFCKKHRKKTVLLFPQCQKGFQWVDVPWTLKEHSMPRKPSMYMELAMRLLKAKIREYRPDMKRIYAGGISMGGFGAWDIASRMPDTFAAILSICGGADTSYAAALSGTAVYALHGDADGAVLTSRTRDMVEAMKKCGNDKIVYRELPGVGHNAWDAAFADEEALEWIYNQKRK